MVFRRSLWTDSGGLDSFKFQVSSFKFQVSSFWFLVCG